MRTTVFGISLWACLWAACAYAQPGSDGSSTTRLVADVLAAESLRNSAMSLVYAPPQTSARAGRLVALSHLADRLVPDDPQTHWLLANIYETQGRLKPASRSARLCLAEHTTDYMLGLRWLRLSIETFDSAAERADFLKSLVADTHLPEPLRAAGAAQEAQILLGQASRTGAIRAFDEALRLDPYQSAALNGKLALFDNPAPARQAEAMCRLLRGNPLAVAVAWDLGVLLDTLGLYTQSLSFFDYAWALANNAGNSQQVSHLFIVQYFNAMLDAGEFRRAVEAFGPMLDRFGNSVDIRSLLIEAHHALSQDAEAQRHIQVLADAYKAREAVSSVSAAFAGELAWFNLMTRRRPIAALVFARQAGRISSDDPVVQRILGAAELAAGQTEQGRKRLEGLLSKDLYAAAFLAEHYFAEQNEVSGRRALLAGASLGRSGPAFRRLLALARKHNVVIPPADGSEEVRKLVDAFDRRYLQMGLAPEKFISVAIRPIRDRPAPGEPLEIEATLTNRGPVDVPIGNWGLLNPAMSLEVTLNGPSKSSFSDLPLVVFPAPRYLAPGRTVRCRVRIDVGRLAAFLARHPLEEFVLNVEGIVDPLQKGETFRSSLPSVRPTPVVITRASLLGQFDRSKTDEWPGAYQRALGSIDEGIGRGTLRRRMLAARQLASLLALVCEVEESKASMPKPLADIVKKPVLLSMLQAVLADEADVVRAEMLAALGHVHLDESIITLLAGAIEDRSSLVRFRLVELLGASGAAGQETIVDYLAQDSDKMVRLMALAFRDGPKSR